jgi:signal transduction histidine kinase
VFLEKDLLRQRDQLRKLAGDLTLVEQNQRRRLAIDLHDYLAQLLVVCRMQTQKALASPLKQMMTSELAEVDSLLDQALTYTHTLVAELCPKILFDVGLAPALAWLGGQMSQRGLIVHVKLDSDLSPLAEDQAILLYQSIRELLFNVLKHAKTDSADVFVKKKGDGTLEVMVCDSGKGCEMREINGSDTHHKTFGLFNIKERIEAMEGQLSIDTRPREGMKVVISLPLQSPQFSHMDYPQASPLSGTPHSHEIAS